MIDIKGEHMKELQESKELFRDLLECAPDAMVVVDGNGIIQLVNEQTGKIFGYAKEELIGQNVELLIPGRFKNLHQNQREKFAENPKSRPMGGKTLDILGRRKNEEEFPAEISLSPVRTSGGNLLIYAAIRDITKRKEKDEQIRYQANLIANIQDAAIAMDNNLVIQSWNKGAEKIYGWTADEVIGKDAGNIFKAEYVEMKKNTRMIEELIREGSYKEEVIHSRKDGERINIFSSGNVLRNEKEEITGIVTINRDITELKSVESRLRESEEQIRTIFHNAPEAVILITENSEIKEWNPFAEKIFGWKKEEVMEKNLYDLIIPERFREAHKIGMKKGCDSWEEKAQPHLIELPSVRKDGTEFEAGISISPFNYRGKRFFIGFLTDITSRKKAEAELKKKSEELVNSNKELEQFAYVASHDLQEPLRMVNGYMQLLERRYKDQLDNDAKDFINFAMEGSNRMRKLINSLLEYSRVNRIKSFEQIKTNQLLLEVLNDLKAVAKENNAEVKIGSVPDMYGDPVLIAQLFQNLIGNALKFKSDRPVEVIVSGESNKEFLQFSVKDNGIGIHPDYFDKIFEMFKRLNPRDKYPGTGMGLAICKKIVERHNGKIWLDSEEGRGSAFYFTIKN